MKYESFNQTVRGTSHMRRDLPCQDASGSLLGAGGHAVAASVADGHGDRKCPRSDVGAILAVEVALDDLASFSRHLATNTDLDVTDRTLRRLTDAISSHWHSDVLDDALSRPLRKRDMPGEGLPVEVSYGSTLIAGAVVDDLLVLVQQGDGHCVAFLADGTVGEPIPWDDRCEGQLSTSLCDPDVADSFRSCAIDLSSSPVAAVFMATDGLEDGLGGMVGAYAFFAGVARDIARTDVSAVLNGTEGTPALDERLSRISELGNGDDISLSAMVDRQALLALGPTLDRLVETFHAHQELERVEEDLSSMTRKDQTLRARLDDARAEYEDYHRTFSRLELRRDELLGFLGGDSPC